MHYTIKMYRSHGSKAPHSLDLPFKGIKSDQCHILASLPQENCPWTQGIWGWVGPRTIWDKVVKSNILTLLLDIWLWSFSPKSSSLLTEESYTTKCHYIPKYCNGISFASFNCYPVKKAIFIPDVLKSLYEHFSCYSQKQLKNTRAGSCSHWNPWSQMSHVAFLLQYSINKEQFGQYVKIMFWKKKYHTFKCFVFMVRLARAIN